MQQYRVPVRAASVPGYAAPSLKRSPTRPPHVAHRTVAPVTLSRKVDSTWTAPADAGAPKHGHPVRASNLAPDWKSVERQAAHT